MKKSSHKPTLKPKTLLLATIILALLLQNRPLFAETTQPPQNPFALSFKTEAIIFSTTTISALTSYAVPKIIEHNNPSAQNAQNAQNAFNPADFGATASRAKITAFDNIFDGAFVRPYNKKLNLAGTASAALAMITPVAIIFAPEYAPLSQLFAPTSKDTRNTYFSVGTMYIETLSLAFALKNTLKDLVYKPRPYMYYDNYPLSKVEEGDWNRSFPSGHTTYAFAAAAFVTYVIPKLTQNDTLKVAVPVTAYTLAATTAILRIASGNHFLTDVLAGAAIGTLSGLAVPFIHEKIATSSASKSKIAEPVLTPLSVSLRFAL